MINKNRIRGGYYMRLEGSGMSTLTKIPTSNEAGQVGMEGKKVSTERRDFPKQKRPEDVKKIEDKKYSEEEVIDIIEKANSQFVAYDRKLEFSIHEKTKQIMIKILDSATNEVIKELPPEKVLDMVAGFMEVAGIIVDEKI